MTRIRHECPQCGGPIELDEEDRLLSCPFCRVRFHLSTPDCFRFTLPIGKKARGRELLLIPYWRFRGPLFSCSLASTEPRLLDTTLTALDVTSLPVSLGLRPQAMGLTFASPLESGRFVETTTSLKQALERVDAVRPGGIHALVGDVASLIYTPTYRRGDLLFDAILDKPCGPAEVLNRLVAASSPEARLDLVPAICPTCGWDLTAERQSCVLLCTNCETAWSRAGGRFEKVDPRVVASRAPNPAYIPFWRFTAKRPPGLAGIVGLTSTTEKGAGNGCEDEFAVWAPAFKTVPVHFLRLARQFSTARIRDEWADRLPKAPIYPITMPACEAAEIIRVVLVDHAIDRRCALEVLTSSRITPEETRLILFPFTPNAVELIQPDLGISIPNGALKVGKNL